jgi:hypothetical protein
MQIYAAKMRSNADAGCTIGRTIGRASVAMDRFIVLVVLLGAAASGGAEQHFTF